MSDSTPSAVPPAEPDAPSAVAASRPPVAALCLAFAAVSISSFGGVLAWARRMLVENKRWMTAQEFNDLLALCQFLPGPNIVNLCAVFGARMRGIPGALACLVGLLGPSVVLMIAAGGAYRRLWAFAGNSGGPASPAPPAARWVNSAAGK